MDWASLHYLKAWSATLCSGYATAARMHAEKSAESFKADFDTKEARETGEDAALTLVDQHGKETSIAQLAVDLNAAARRRDPLAGQHRSHSSSGLPQRLRRNTLPRSKSSAPSFTH